MTENNEKQKFPKAQREVFTLLVFFDQQSKTYTN